MAVTDGLIQAAEVAEAWEATERHAGNSDKADACRDMAKTYRAMAGREVTERVRIGVCKECGGTTLTKGRKR